MIPEEVNQVALPTFEEADQVALPTVGDIANVGLTTAEDSAPPVAPPTAETSVPLPSGEPEVDDMPAIEREFRNLIQELLDSGVDPSEMMTDPRLEDINERALAQNFETWPVFMQMVS